MTSLLFCCWLANVVTLGTVSLKLLLGDSRESSSNNKIGYPWLDSNPIVEMLLTSPEPGYLRWIGWWVDGREGGWMDRWLDVRTTGTG